jgi:hypothetical protein
MIQRIIHLCLRDPMEWSVLAVVFIVSISLVIWGWYCHSWGS